MVSKLTGGGAERVAALWAKGFVQEGHEVGMVLSCSREVPITYEVPNNVKIYYVLRSSICNKAAYVLNHRFNVDFSFYNIHRLQRIVLNFHPDVAIGVLPPWAEWARKACKGLNVKIINTEHNTFERPRNAQYMPMNDELYYKKYELNKLYSHTTVLTEADKKCVDGILNNVSVLPNPLTYEPLKTIPPKENIILAAGRLDAWYVKGFDLLIKAWGAICKSYPKWKLQIAGNYGKEGLGKMKLLADEHRLGQQIEFIGYQDNMQPIYQRSSIFVLSSRYEGFGMVLIEAMSQACAPIACDYKGRQKEIIVSDKDGLICPVDSVKSLADAIEIMIKDRQFREIVQRNAIERSKAFSLDKIMDKWNKIFNDLK